MHNRNKQQFAKPFSAFVRMQQEGYAQQLARENPEVFQMELLEFLNTYQIKP